MWSGATLNPNLDLMWRVVRLQEPPGQSGVKSALSPSVKLMSLSPGLRFTALAALQNSCKRRELKYPF